MSTVRSIERLVVGSSEVLALVDGARDYLPMTAAFPDAPEDELLAYRHDHADLFGRSDAWHLIVRAWIVRHPGGTMLVDTGIGTAVAPAWFGADGELGRLFDEVDVSGDDIDTVVITHVHDDHIGGTVTQEGVVTFPRAKHLIQHADWEWARSSAEADDGSKGDLVIWNSLLSPLQEADLVRFVQGDLPVADGIRLRHVPGHTPGHQVVEVVDGSDRLLISADTFNHPSQLAHPDWSNAADEEPVVAARSRRAILSELASRPDTVVAPTHFVQGFGTVDFEDGADWVPLEGQAGRSRVGHRSPRAPSVRSP